MCWRIFAMLKTFCEIKSFNILIFKKLGWQEKACCLKSEKWDESVALQACVLLNSKHFKLKQGVY